MYFHRLIWLLRNCCVARVQWFPTNDPGDQILLHECKMEKKKLKRQLQEPPVITQRTLRMALSCVEVRPWKLRFAFLDVHAIFGPSPNSGCSIFLVLKVVLNIKIKKFYSILFVFVQPPIKGWDSLLQTQTLAVLQYFVKYKFF